MSNQQPSAKNQGVGRDQLRQRGEEVVAQLGHGTNRPRRQYLATIPGAQGVHAGGRVRIGVVPARADPASSLAGHNLGGSPPCNVFDSYGRT